jgi:hypothetical protein
MRTRLLISARVGVVLIAALLIALAIALLKSGSAPPPAEPELGATRLARGGVPPLPVPPAPASSSGLMSREAARAVNAAVPFAAGPIPGARPFVFVGPPADRERALTCLATAAWYEAGDDADGQRAVVQVVLNRLRHPAFPKSICGVVFQGAERLTGCQFTFTCDGALARTPSAAAWQRARDIATRALGGAVDSRVGTATHYHTDCVAPYWSATLDKIAAVRTHLFFRWRGWWGTLPAFSGRYRGPETLDARIVALAAPIGRPDLSLQPLPVGTGDAISTPEGGAIQIPGVTDAALRGSVVRLTDPSATEFVIELAPLANPGGYALTALAICTGKPVCTVMGWLKRAKMPREMPVVPAMLQSVSFLYRRNIDLDREQVFWNCQQIPRLEPVQCLPGTGPTPEKPPV